MGQQERAKETWKMVVLVAFISIMVLPLALGADPYAQNPVPGWNFSAAEDQLFNRSIVFVDDDGHTPINFTTTAGDSDVGFYCFSKDRDGSTATTTTYVMNFTPSNTYVGVYEFDAILRDANGESELYWWTFTVNNTNDQPNIPDSSPASPATVPESGTLNLDIDVTDDDLSIDPSFYAESISYRWLLDGNTSWKLNMTTATNTTSAATYSPRIVDFDAGLHNITVVAKDRENASANHTWVINVTNVNRLPTFAPPLDDNITWPEDHNVTDHFTLANHFNDSDTNGTECDLDTGFCLQYGYEVVNGTAGNITVDIDNGSNVSFYPQEDWNGNMSVRFYVYDGYNRTYSNVVNLSVIKSNDPPHIDPIPNQTTYGYAEYNYSVNAYDVEGQPLTYGLDAPTLPNLSIDSGGMLQLDVTNAMVGNHTVNVSVSDPYDTSWEIYTLEIVHNDAPVITGVANHSMMQYGSLSFMLEVADPDGDAFTFVQDPEIMTMTQYNATHWNFSITPESQQLVGTHQINLTAVDVYGAISRGQFELEINDTYFNPRLFPVSVPGDRIRSGKRFVHEVIAFDEDGDFSLFGDDTPLFDVSTVDTGSYDRNATGYVNFTPLDGDIGYYTINITANDTQGLWNSTIFRLNITDNHVPYFTSIDDILTPENTRYTQDVEASDFDWQDQDELLFGDNTTIFDIDPDTGLIDFSYPDVGNYSVNVWVYDGEYNVSRNISVNITPRNDPPFFLENLAGMPEWDSFMEDDLTNFTIGAEDEEGDAINLSIRFVSFTDLRNITFTSGIDLFNFSRVWNNSLNQSFGYINVTPNATQVGTYVINITASDNWSSSSEEFEFNVANRNNPPVLNWTLEYPADNLTISSYADNFQMNASESRKVYIHTNVTDLDYDDIRYEWIVRDHEGRVAETFNTSSISYSIPYTGYPNQTIYLTAYDEANATDTVTYFMKINDTNRNVTFGIRRFPFSDSEGTHVKTSVTDGMLRAAHNGNGTSYHQNATYTSPYYDMGAYNADVNRINHSYLTFDDAGIQSGYSLSYEFGSVQQTSDIIEYGLVGGDGSIVSDNRRYVRFRVNMSTNGTVTPYLENATLKYHIPNITVDQGTQFGAWLDLDNFFDDKDPDDTVTYNVSILEGGDAVTVSLTLGHFVEISFHEVGTAVIQFNATDGDSVAQSNEIHITIEERDEENDAVPQPSSGGGGTRIEYQYKYRNTDVPIAFDIIHPENVTVHTNSTIQVPIKLKNDEEFSLKDVTINATVEQEGLSHSFDRSRIDEIPSGTTDKVMLTLSPSTLFDSYEAVINVSVRDPEYSDSAKILISSLKKAEGDNQSEQMKLSFVTDLLEKNQECVEISEYIDRAKQAIENGSVEYGNHLLDLFVRDCKALIQQGGQEPVEERPSRIQTVEDVTSTLLSDRDTQIVLGTILAAIIMTAIIILTILYRKI